MHGSVDYRQAERLLRIATPLGEDALLLERFEGREAVNELFALKATVRAKRDDLEARDLVGRRVDVTLDLGEWNSERRVWNALVTDLEEDQPLTRGLRRYVLTLSPDLWLLSQRSDCRIWQNKTAVEVAQTLCSEHGLPSPRIAYMHLELPSLDYSAQWNETDLDYLCRRLEESGIFYWFEHKSGENRLVLANHAVAYARPGDGKVRLSRGSQDGQGITSFKRQFHYTPGKRTGADWNFERPRSIPGGTTPTIVKLDGNAEYELYEYPARIQTNTEGERASRLRMQACEVDFERTGGASTVRWLAPAQRFSPYELAGNKVHDPIVLACVEHEAEDTTYEVGGEPAFYLNRFEAAPAETPLTPHRRTKRPRIEGHQIGIVAGPSGEEIHCDAYGRVKVWFPWDRRAKKDGSDTCWLRVGQSWAGGKWGSQVIPRIGMEVMVAYIDGDPDRPMVAGVVPNPVTAVPYKLPEHKTRMVLRSNTHKGEGFNELSFEDEAGKENMFLHAQKDQTTRVLNNRTKRVDAHEVASIGANRAVEVGGNQKHEIGGSMNLTVGGTGAAAMGLAQMAVLSGQTAGLLTRAGEVAGGGASLGPFTATIAQSALGFLSGSGLGAREGVVAGVNPRGDAGTALAGSGAGVGEDAGSLFPLSGIMNIVVGSFQSTTVGVAQAEQIGMSKVVNVGATYLENVGQEQHTRVGRVINVQVGELYNVASGEKYHGEAKTWHVIAEDEIRLSAPGGYIVINKTGIRLHALKIDIEGNEINFRKGGPGDTSTCLKRMSENATHFVRMG